MEFQGLLTKKKKKRKEKKKKEKKSWNSKTIPTYSDKKIKNNSDKKRSFQTSDDSICNGNI